MVFPRIKGLLNTSEFSDEDVSKEVAGVVSNLLFLAEVQTKISAEVYLDGMVDSLERYYSCRNFSNDAFYSSVIMN